jgi:hypothetical protein
LDRFEYVMVLISIIVGLSIAHVLLGVGGIIDRKASGPPLRLGFAHPIWLVYVFVWTVQFWWWEFRFAELAPVWTIGLYLFLVAYAVALFLLSVILVPRSWDGITDLDRHFLQRKLWFYPGFLIATGIDVVDTWLKGGLGYIVEEFGPILWFVWIGAAVAFIVGLRSDRPSHHAMVGATMLVLQFLQQFADVPTLGF